MWKLLITACLVAISSMADVERTVKPVSVISVGQKGRIVHTRIEALTAQVTVKIPVVLERANPCAAYTGQRLMENDLGQQLLVPSSVLNSSSDCDVSGSPAQIETEFEVEFRAMIPSFMPPEPIQHYTIEIDDLGTYLVTVSNFRDVTIQSRF